MFVWFLLFLLTQSLYSSETYILYLLLVLVHCFCDLSFCKCAKMCLCFFLF
uniref:Uncharacterized protein n=1 Tax=Arundo donax TaxID=35708 RepID=A0A0A8YQX5_ARUDO